LREEGGKSICDIWKLYRTDRSS